MSSNFLFFNFFYFLSVVSTLGYGFYINNLLVSKNVDLDYGTKGLIGIFILTLYSILSHFFISHNFIHNSILFLLGIILFIFFLKFNYQKKDFKIVCLVFIILLIAFFCFKTHDDFPYYHFPYTNYLTKSDLIIGVGNYDPSWRSPSSIFYFNSLFYLPIVKYYSYHIGALLIMGYSLSILCIKMFHRYNLKNFDQLFFYKLLSFTFILIFFYRLAEHGTDRSAQTLSFILILEILYFFKKEQDLNKFFTKILIIGSLAISLKVFYLVYLILLIPIFQFIYVDKKKLCINELIKNKFFYLSILLLLLVTIVNFLNSGCLLYPLTASCFDSFSWSTSLIEVDRMRFHYENWAKSGAGPSFSLNNINENIAYFNWLPGWVERYFFNKVSDYLLGLLFMCIIFLIIFCSNKKNSNKKKLRLNFLYIILVFLFIEWFYNHPTLRYGGYSIIAILVFIPMSKFLSNYHIKKNLNVRIILILCLTISIFFYRNIDRLAREYKQYNYTPLKVTYYNVIENHHFRVEKEFSNIVDFYKDCTKKRIECKNQNKLIAYKKYGKFIFVKPSKFEIKQFNGKDILIKIN